MQIAKSLDPVTVEKIKKSAKIALGGALLVALPLFTKELTDFILTNDPIDLRTIAATTIGAIGTWCVNSVREFLKGEEPKP
jgi:hypothetical protein